MDTYNTLPDYPLTGGSLAAGYDALAERLLASSHTVWVLDGMSGVDWASLREGLRVALGARPPTFLDVGKARLGAATVKRVLADALDNGDSVFGKLYAGELADFFDPDALATLRRHARQLTASGELVVCLGQGSALLDLEGAYLWADLSKEIITGMAAAGRDEFLGTPAYPAMKSIYWVDWPVLERHKTALLGSLDLYLDMADPARPVVMGGDALRASLASLARQPFRVKPVFYPGAWGGQWMKRHMRLDPEKPNYAWSYELIAPENGVVFRDSSGAGDLRAEVPLEFLMAGETINVQGPVVAERFGTSFPIRFNYDDTIEGGNLSCQVHPLQGYAEREFGLPYTQDETYYILRAGEGGVCYLGLKEGADPQAFRQAAERARDAGIAFDTADFVNVWPTHTHDLFLIPAGTVHNSGANNVVLEISATPYLYTFKIYDYLRRDLNGTLRPIHIERAFDNLDTSRTTPWVREHLIPGPRVQRTGDGWTEYVVGEHALMYIAIHRVEFGNGYDDDTRRERFHVLNLVEGDQVVVEWSGGQHPLHYAETIVIPAAVGPYRVRQQCSGVCKVVKAFVRDPVETPIGQ